MVTGANSLLCRRSGFLGVQFTWAKPERGQIDLRASKTGLLPAQVREEAPACMASRLVYKEIYSSRIG
jgi:hypothetical protein